MDQKVHGQHHPCGAPQFHAFERPINALRVLNGPQGERREATVAILQAITEQLDRDEKDIRWLLYIIVGRFIAIILVETVAIAMDEIESEPR
jgi:hypothetical protein